VKFLFGWLGILLFVLFMVSCVSDEANRYYADETYPAKKTDEVEVLTEAPLRPYVVIADMQARNASINFMRKRAAKIGADAVIVVHAGGSYSQTEDWADKDRHSSSYTRLIGTAIKYK